MRPGAKTNNLASKILMSWNSLAPFKIFVTLYNAGMPQGRRDEHLGGSAVFGDGLRTCNATITLANFGET